MSFLDYFPKHIGEPRQKQIEILNEIEEAYQSGYKYFVLKAGTGIGKSPIAIALARYFKKAYILTATNNLQRQYAEEYDLNYLMGRNNFICKTYSDAEEEVECGDGLCQQAKSKSKCYRGVLTGKKAINRGLDKAFLSRSGVWYWKGEDHCDYWEQKSNVINSNIALMNYSSYYLEMNYIPMIFKQPLVVFDEANYIENILMQNRSALITNRGLSRIYNLANKNYDLLDPEVFKDDSGSGRCVDNWIERLDCLNKRFHNILGIAEKLEFKKKTINTIENYIKRFDAVIDGLKKEPSNYIFQRDKDGNERIEIKPIWIGKYVKNDILEHILQFGLFMSATIPPKEEFCRWFGFDCDEIAYSTYESDFPLNNRKISIIDRGRMNYKNANKLLPIISNEINSILHKHPEEKGVVHTHSHYNAQNLLYGLDLDNRKRIVWYSDPINESYYGVKNFRNDAIDEFLNSKEPSVLVGPSIKEGLDLPDDLCRFQIIMKIPFPNMGDKQVKARMEDLNDNKNWFNYKTVNDLEQSYGRGIRHKNDYCHTYIVDGNIKFIMNNPKTRRYISSYMMSALKLADNL